MPRIKKSYPTKQINEEGSCPVNRMFGYDELSDFDPFLLLDYFDVDMEVGKEGFPWHPHKGMETMTYLLKGCLRHEDSAGFTSELGPSEFQWMTSGRGIFHQEIPILSEEKLQGFQLWVNMPSRKKLDMPNYDVYMEDQLKVIKEDGLVIKVLSGTYDEYTGPLNESELKILFLDVEVHENKHFIMTRDPLKNSFIYVYNGYGMINEEEYVNQGEVYTLDSGTLDIRCTSSTVLRFIIAEGIPIDEPIAWKDSIVMNTPIELVEALKDLKRNKFI